MSAAAGRFAIISPGASDRQQQLLPGLHVACPAPMWRSPGSRCSRAGGPSGPRDSPRVGVLAAAAAARPAAFEPMPACCLPHEPADPPREKLRRGSTSGSRPVEGSLQAFSQRKHVRCTETARSRFLRYVR
ncbi:unnamed protein product [Diplocarpon coronariae]